MTTRRDGGPDRACQEETWRALMRAAQDGDRLAYTQLLHEVTPILRRIVRRKWWNAQEVEDLVQDVLLSLHAVRHTYDPARPFMPWIMTIARRRIADAARRAARRNAHEIFSASLPETFPMEPTNTGQESREDAMALREALVALPSGQREAVDLLKLKGLSLAEASAVSGKSVVALKVAMHRALGTLRHVFSMDA